MKTVIVAFMLLFYHLFKLTTFSGLKFQFSHCFISNLNFHVDHPYMLTNLAGPMGGQLREVLLYLLPTTAANGLCSGSGVHLVHQR